MFDFNSFIKLGLIYQAINKKTGESYIGKTSRRLSERKSEHKKEKKPFYFAKKFKKSPKDWKFKILKRGIRKEKLSSEERKFIRKFRPTANRRLM